MNSRKMPYLRDWLSKKKSFGKLNDAEMNYLLGMVVGEEELIDYFWQHSGGLIVSSKRLANTDNPEVLMSLAKKVVCHEGFNVESLPLESWKTVSEVWFDKLKFGNALADYETAQIIPSGSFKEVRFKKFIVFPEIPSYVTIKPSETVERVKVFHSWGGRLTEPYDFSGILEFYPNLKELEISFPSNSTEEILTFSDDFLENFDKGNSWRGWVEFKRK